MKTVIKRSRFDFYCWGIVTVLLWIMSIYYSYHFFYSHYYFALITVFYAFKSLYRYIVIDSRGLEISWGILNQNKIFLNWTDIDRISLSLFQKTVHSSAGGYVAIPVIEKYKVECLKILLAYDVPSERIDPLFNKEIIYNADSKELYILHEPQKGFGNLIEIIEIFFPIEEKLISEKQFGLTRQIIYFVGLLFIITYLIGLLAFIAFFAF